MYWSYARMSEYLGAKNERPSPLTNPSACRIIRVDDNTIALKHHATRTVVWHSDGSVTVDSGGWRTVTTKAHINEFLYDTCLISQRKGVWYAEIQGEEFVFVDGMKLCALANLPGKYIIISNQPQDPAEVAKLRKRIRKYAKDFAAHAVENAGKFKPGLGDCVFCSMLDGQTGLGLGDAVKDKGHLLEHMDEGYYVPSLLANALKEKDISHVARGVLDGLHGYDTWRDVAKTQVQASVQAYMERRLVHGLFDARRA